MCRRTRGLKILGDASTTGVDSRSKGKAQYFDFGEPDIFTTENVCVMVSRFHRLVFSEEK